MGDYYAGETELFGMLKSHHGKTPVSIMIKETSPDAEGGVGIKIKSLPDGYSVRSDDGLMEQLITRWGADNIALGKNKSSR
jgi:hypothetical protein